MQKTLVCSGLGKSPGGQGNLLWYSCLENPHGQRNLAGLQSPWSCKFVGHNWATKHIIQCTYKHTHYSHSTYRDFYLFLDANLSRYLNTFQAFYEKLVLYMGQVFFFCSGIIFFDPYQGNCYLHIWLLQRNWCPSWKTKIRNVHNMEQIFWLNTWL